MSKAYGKVTDIQRKTRTLESTPFAHIDIAALIDQGEPCIIKHALDHCPLVNAGRQSHQAAMSHLEKFASDQPLLNYIASEKDETRFFYNTGMDGLNFTTEFIHSDTFFEKILREQNATTTRSYYVGSAELAHHFPGLLEHEGLAPSAELFNQYPPRIGIWLGNKTTAATHFDVSNNLAACMVGKRRFTLFPPDQIENLYPGPLEPTPGGQVVSMFDPNKPDFEKFPNAKKALEHAEVAELEAGDILIYPAMWWHQVEALDTFNVLINYWWNTVPTFIDDPMHTLWHALLSLRDRPEHEKNAWRHLFDFYIFGDADASRSHLPEHIRGPLGPMDNVTARRLRARLTKKLNR